MVIFVIQKKTWLVHAMRRRAARGRSKRYPFILRSYFLLSNTSCWVMASVWDSPTANIEQDRSCKKTIKSSYWYNRFKRGKTSFFR